MTVDQQPLPTNIQPYEEYARTADAMVAFWNKVTHFIPPEGESQESRGTVLELPVDYIELADQYGADALQILQHPKLLKSWANSPSTAIQLRRGLVFQALSALATINALDTVRGNTRWRDGFHRRSGQSSSETNHTVIGTPEESLFMALVVDAHKDATAYVERESLGEQFSQPLQQLVDLNTLHRAQELQQLILEYTARNGHAPQTSLEMQELATIARVKFPPLATKQLDEKSRTQNAAATEQTQIKAWKTAVANARRFRDVVDSITRLDSAKKAAVKRYYQTLAEQNETVLPDSMRLENKENTRENGTPFEQQLAIDLGYGIPSPTEDHPQRMIASSEGITAARKLLIGLKADFMNALSQPSL